MKEFLIFSVNVNDPFKLISLRDDTYNLLHNSLLHPSVPFSTSIMFRNHHNPPEITCFEDVHCCYIKVPYNTIGLFWTVGQFEIGMC